MIKLFIDVRPKRDLLCTANFTEESIKKLLTLTEVETNFSFDTEDTVSFMVLSAADLLKQCFNEHDIDARVGIIYNYSPNYPGWLLVFESGYIEGSINPLIAKFFSWDKIEKQQILSFNEVMGSALKV